MNITARNLLGVMSGKRVSKLFSVLIGGVIISLSACSTLYDFEPDVVEGANSNLPSNVVTTETDNTGSVVKPPPKVDEKMPSKSAVAEKPIAVSKVETPQAPAPIVKESVLKKASVKPATKKIVKEKKVKPLPQKTALPAKTKATKDRVVQDSEAHFKKYQVDLAKLPIKVGKNWVLNRGPESAGQCALSNRKLAMSDGQGETPVSIIISKDRIVFKTKSYIDLAYTQTGLTIDDLPQTPIEKLLDDYSISYEQNYLNLIDNMKNGDKATLDLGFWPSWPMTHTYSLRFDLGDFSSAQQALLDCIALEKQLK